MKALTLWQPWATLIAAGLKRYETRDWPTRYRGPLAIHAGRRCAELEVCGEIWDALPASYRLKFGQLLPWIDWLPRGAVVAVAELTHCYRMSDEFVGRQTALERALGAWVPGRAAWRLVDVRALAEPVPARGKQGLWDWHPQAELDLEPQTHADTRG